MKITKTPKRLAPATPEVSALQALITKTSDDQLPDVLDSVSEWCWPRGDLYYWAGVLNRFDTILETASKDYELSNIQVNPFTPLTKRILISILRFSRLLIENCTNRKLYNSYEHLNDLLLTRDLDVLETALRLVLRSAQQHSSSHPPRHEFQVSKDRITTLAMTWTPRDHGLSLVDIAKEDAVIPPDLAVVRFQFFKRNSHGQPVAPSLTALDATPIREVDSHIMSTPTRTRVRDTRTNPATNLSASIGPVTPAAARHEDRGEASSASLPRKEGLVNVDLGKVTDSAKDAINILSDAVELYSVPQEERFELFQRIRLALLLSDPLSRKQLLVCRILAMACYGHVIPESTANTQLFLFEPDLVHRVAALVDPIRKIDLTIQSSAFYALDCLGRYRGKVTEVLNSVNASVNHGIILSALRNLVQDLSSDSPQSSDLFVDSLFSFTAFITSVATGSNMIVSAGLVPVLVQLVKIPNPNQYMVQRTVTRALGLVDSVTYSLPHAFDLFCSARGLEALVERIQHEIDRDIRDAANDQTKDTTTTLADPGPDNLYGKLAFGRASLLRGMFKSISQMMGTTGTGEGLRNLIDSSLPVSLKKIIQYRSIFGPQIMALAINIMSTFVHNEPTSLAIIQEVKLPEAFFTAIEQDIEANYEVIASIPNAIGALCLNQAGLDLFNSRAVVPKLFALITSERHGKVFQDRDNASMFGASIDELIRHQPSIKQTVMDSIMTCLDEIHRLGNDFTLPESIKSRSAYGLVVVPQQSEPSPLSGEHQVTRTVALVDVITDEPDPIRKDETKPDPNPIVMSIDVISRFLEGLFQTSSHCKDFLKLDGLDKLLACYSLPCLPYDFSASVTADSLVTLIRYMTEISPSTVLMVMLRDVRKVLRDAKSIWGLDASADQGQEKLLNESKLVGLFCPRTEAQAEEANRDFRKLISLCSRTHLLSDVCQTFTYAGHKMPSTFLQTLNTGESSGAVSIAELGHLYRLCAWENMLLKAALPRASKDEAKPDVMDSSATQSQDPASATAATELPRPSQAGVPADLLQDVAGTVEQPESQTLQTAHSNDDQDPKAKNAAALRYVSSQIPSSLTSFFQETVKLLAPRRSVDPSHKKIAHQTAGEIAKSMRMQLDWQPFDNLTNSFAFATSMICHTSCLLFDDRSSPNTVHTAILRAFDKCGGLEALFELYRRYSDEIDHHYNADGELQNKSLSDIEAGLRLGHTCGGLKVLLGFFLRLVIAKGLLDSSQTNQLIKEGGMDPFEPHAYLVKLRAAILPVIRSTWGKPWLPSLPASVNRLALQNMLVILKAQSESGPIKKPISSTQPMSLASGLPAALVASLGAANPFSSRRTSNPQPDEERIRHLTDMGFPRNAARYALLRCQNNLSAATEYLLTHGDLAAQLGAEQEAESVSASAASGSGIANPDAANENSESQAAETLAFSNHASTTAENEEGDAQMKDAESEKKQKNEEIDETNDLDKVTSLKADLDAQRNEIKQTLIDRALELADHHESLVFEVKNAFLLVATSASLVTSNLLSLMKTVRAEMAECFNRCEDPIAVRVRLLALLLQEEDVYKKIQDEAAIRAMSDLGTLASLYMMQPVRHYDKEQERKEDEDASFAWLASLMLAAVTLLGLDEDTVDLGSPTLTDRENLPANSDIRVRREPMFESESKHLYELAFRALEQANRISRDDLLAAYRLLAVLTRRPKLSLLFVHQGGIPLVLRPFHLISPKNVSGCQTYAIMILRHIVEDSNTLQIIMDQALRSSFSQARNKAAEISNMVRNLDHAILRDPDAFLKAATSRLELSDFSVSKNVGHVKLIESIDPTDKDSSTDFAAGGQASLASLRLGDDPMDVASSPTKEAAPTTADQAESKTDEPFSKSTQTATNTPSEELDTLMQFLLSEILKHGREGLNASASKKNAPANAADCKTSPCDPQPPTGAVESNNVSWALDLTAVLVETEEQKQADRTYFYTCFIMQCLTELLSSYNSCKASFVNFSKKRLFMPAANVPTGLSSTPGPKDVYSQGRAKMGVLNFFLTEMVPAGFLQSYESTELRKRMAQSNWAMSVIVALTADVSLHTDSKEAPSELINVRKAVLDAIAKAIKEASASAEPIEVRYGRLYALSDLCYRLLIARPNGTAAKPAQTEDLTLHMAKTMLEKNFVTVLTSALADVDLNLPTVKTLLDAILRPLEYLTKIAIKMGKAKDRQGQNARAEESDDESLLSSDDYSMDDEDEEDGEEMPGREETPDFYRNSSLGMHTGEMEQGFEDDDMSDDDIDEDDEDIDMEEYDSESGSEMSSDSEEEEDDDPHVVEVMEDDDEDDEMDASEDEEGSERFGEHGEDDEDGWTDEDSDDEEIESDDETLDFVFDDVDGDLHGAPDSLDDGADHGLLGEDVFGGDVLVDEDDADGMDDESIDDHFENEELSHLELAEDVIAQHQPNDRFGANWFWSALPDSRAGRIASGDRVRSTSIFPPNFFLSNAIEAFHGASGHRRPRLQDLESNLLGPRRNGAQNDDVTSHPLLVDQSDVGDMRASSGSRNRRANVDGTDGHAEWAQSMEELLGDGAIRFLETILTRGQDSSTLRIELMPDGNSAFNLNRATAGGRPGTAASHRESANSDARKNDPVAIVQAFMPQPTSTRWSEEARLLHPTTSIASTRSNRLQLHLIKILYPPYKKRREEEKKKREDAEAEYRKAKEERDKAQRELDEAKAKLRDAEERAKQEQAEAEAAEAQRAAASRAEAAAAAQPTEPSSEQRVGTTGDDVEMVEASQSLDAEHQPAQPSATAEVSAPPERVTVQVNGEEVDITDTGIDPTFLEALPDYLREEVLNQHFRERRATEATSQLPQSSNIAPEFLDALPAELREEVIQQVAMESSQRRIREQLDETTDNRLQNAQGMFRALDPEEMVMMSGSEFLANVIRRAEQTAPNGRPQNLDDEGGNLAGAEARPSMAYVAGASRTETGRGAGNVDNGASVTKKATTRDAIQLLDKPGVATLVRLLFFPQMNGKQTGLYKVLANLSENSKTRAELLNLLLVVLSEGSVDAHSVDKSFASMSSRANKMHATPSRPTPKRLNSGPASVQQSSAGLCATAPLSRTGDEAPFLIASRSIETLQHLTSANQQAALYFLRDDSRPLKKGKGKEKEKEREREREKEEKATAPINVLLGLLSKETILSNSQLVDSLLSLLNTATKPLLSLPKQPSDEKKQGDKEVSASAESKVLTEGQPEGQITSPPEVDSSHVQQASGSTATVSTCTTQQAAEPAALVEQTTKNANDAELMVAPVIPIDRLSAIVKPLATAISSKGFQNTLAVALHLSTIEGARDAICEALHQQAEVASKSLLGDLDQLIDTLPEPAAEDDFDEQQKKAKEGLVEGKATEGTPTITMSGPTWAELEGPMGSRIQSTALANLASPASAQAVLLRSLRALDYIMTGR